MPIRVARYAYQSGTVCLSEWHGMPIRGTGGAPPTARRRNGGFRKRSGRLSRRSLPYAQTKGRRWGLPYKGRRGRRRSEGPHAEPRTDGGRREPEPPFLSTGDSILLQAQKKLKKLHQSHIWCRSILMSVCHTLKSTSIVCSGRGFSPYQCQSAKKADVKGGRKPPRSACP